MGTLACVAALAVGGAILGPVLAHAVGNRIRGAEQGVRQMEQDVGTWVRDLRNAFTPNESGAAGPSFAQADPEFAHLVPRPMQFPSALPYPVPPSWDGPRFTGEPRWFLPDPGWPSHRRFFVPQWWERRRGWR